MATTKTTTDKSAAPYKGHRAGSRKGAVHRVFDEKGVDAAYDYGVRKKLADGTVLSWLSTWRRDRKAAKAKAAKKAGTNKNGKSSKKTEERVSA